MISNEFRTSPTGIAKLFIETLLFVLIFFWKVKQPYLPARLCGSLLIRMVKVYNLFEFFGLTVTESLGSQVSFGRAILDKETRRLNLVAHFRRHAHFLHQTVGGLGSATDRKNRLVQIFASSWREIKAEWALRVYIPLLLINHLLDYFSWCHTIPAESILSTETTPICWSFFPNCAGLHYFSHFAVRNYLFGYALENVTRRNNSGKV